LKKIFAIFAIFIFLSACSTQLYDGLVGTWHWSGDAALSYTFNADGTGERGFPEVREGFVWNTNSRGHLNIERNFVVQGEIREERWNFSIDGDALTIRSRQAAGAEFVYLLGGAGEFPPELVGMAWQWDEHEDFVYIFFADGTARRGLFGDGAAEEITWFANGSRLHIFSSGETFGVRGEMWTFSVENDVLTLKSEQWAERIYTYRGFRLFSADAQ